MGQGYSMTTLSAASASLNAPELADLTPEKTLASARFMKSIRARNSQGFVFIKIVMKPYPSFDVQDYIRQILQERRTLADIPNALGYQKLVESGDAGFLLRQYMFSSVYDRLSTRPFLEDIEKKWLAFQLLSVVRDCHARNVFHGDIKTENLLVTSWNWLYLTDFSSSFKPTNLPEDNPADFSFYFDTSGRRTCYIAPERFTTTSVGDLQGELNWAMDIFSVGCTIAEIFLEGPIFSLSQIFKYRSGEYSPEHTHLNKIEDPEVRAMILNMIELDPEKRYSAEQHLSFYRSKIFPDYFYSFLHQYMLDLTRTATPAKPVILDDTSQSESDDNIERVYYDFDKIAFFLGYGPSPSKQSFKSPNVLRSSNPVKLQDTNPALYDGSLLFLTLVVASLRNTAKASARLKACDLLVAFAERLPDEAKLDRILPYIVGLLSDSSDIVKTAAIYALTAIFEMVQTITPINAYVFPEYLFPSLRMFVLNPNNEPSVLVRSAYASCLASLALSSSRILDMIHAIRADGRLPALRAEEWAPESSYHGLYDVARAELIPHFEEATVALITDPEPSVKRALLASIARLCVFFGSTKASEVVLTHLNTYLNEKDWILRCAFFEALVGIASYVGTSSLEQFILPIMVGSLIDSEVFVIEKVFRSLARMADLGLLQKATTWELVDMATRFLVHPSFWVRESAVQFIVLSCRYTSKADQACIVLPRLEPFLKGKVISLTEDRILDNLKRPLSKSVFDAAVSWAARKGNSIFWTAASRDGAFSLSDPSTAQTQTSFTTRLLTRINPAQKDKDDQASLETLRNLGMTVDDEIKLLALREYIWHVSNYKSHRDPDQLVKDKDIEDRDEKHRILNNIVSLNQIDVTPQNIFFDQRRPVEEIRNRNTASQPRSRRDERHSLADALLDASTSINEGPVRNHSPSRPATDGSHAGSVHPISIETAQGRKGPPSLNIEEGSLPSSLNLTNGGHSPAGVERLSLRRNTPLALRHRNSGINLMNRKDSSKADAEISTNSEIAFGKVDGAISRRNTSGPSALSVTANVADKSRSISSSPGRKTPAYELKHSYSGNDPNILRLLDHHFMENFPVDLIEFGPRLTSVDFKWSIKRATDVPSQGGSKAAQQELGYRSEPWRPTGQLLTSFHEHTGAINRVCAAPDHAFFITASDDGSCKVWDSIRLEKNVTPRSRMTHRHAEGARVKSLCCVEGTHTFVSGADDGSIHLVRVDYKSLDGGESSKYGKPRLIRDYQIPPKRNMQQNGDDEDGVEYAVWLHHYRTQTSQSILLAATNKCRILAIDLKNMEIVHIMENPMSHGTPTTFCMDRKQHWLLLGTSHGILDLWDLRFKLNLRSFGIQTSSRIDRILIHPTKGHGRWVMVSAGGEISVWDIEKLVCREVLRNSTFEAEDNLRPYEAFLADGETGERVLGEMTKDATNDALVRDGVDGTNVDNVSSSSPSKKSPKVGSSSRWPNTLPVSGVFVIYDHLQNTSQPENPNRYALLFTGGADRAVRYWDVGRPEHSFIVSGPMIYNDEGSTVKAKYEVTHPLSLNAGGQIALVQESIPDASSTGDAKAGNTRGTPTRVSRRDQSGASTPSRSGRTTPAVTPSVGGSSKQRTTPGPIKPLRHTVISAEQQHIIRTHMDAVTDVIVLKKPYGCVVSVDRGGHVFVFH